MPGNAHYDKFELRQFIFIMKCIHIITPVKDSIELTLQTAEAILKSDFTVPFHYTIYNDFSTDENTKQLKEASLKMGFELFAGAPDGTREGHCRRSGIVDRGI